MNFVLRLKHYLSFCLLMCPFICTADYHASLASDPQMKTKIQHYFESGDYLREVEINVMKAKQYIDNKLKTTNNQKLAIVLDIDETALSNYESLKEHNFSPNMEAFTASYLLSEQQAIGPVLGLYHYAKRRGVDVFFVGTRPNTPEIINATVRNLKQAGYEGWEDLHLKPLGKEQLSNSEFKTQVRKSIEQQGYSIVVNLGDQTSDLEGGSSELAIKLPNPFYMEQS